MQSSSIVNSTLTNQIKAKYEKLRDNKNVRFGLMIAAVGVGTYYGVKHPFRQIANKMDALTGEVRQVRIDVGEQYLDTMEHRTDAEETKYAQRDAIVEYVQNDIPFAHYPGVGVLNLKAVKEWVA